MSVKYVKLNNGYSSPAHLRMHGPGGSDEIVSWEVTTITTIFLMGPQRNLFQVPFPVCTTIWPDPVYTTILANPVEDHTLIHRVADGLPAPFIHTAMYPVTIHQPVRILLNPIPQV